MSRKKYTHMEKTNGKGLWMKRGNHCMIILMDQCCFLEPGPINSLALNWRKIFISEKILWQICREEEETRDTQSLSEEVPRIRKDKNPIWCEWDRNEAPCCCSEREEMVLSAIQSSILQIYGEGEKVQERKAIVINISVTLVLQKIFSK